MQFNLDDIAAWNNLTQGNDRSNRRLARSVEEAHEMGLKAESRGLPNVKNVDLRARGSAIGGDLLRSLATGKSSSSVNRDYDIPAP